MGSTPTLSGPDLRAGVAESDVRDAMPLLGHADGEAVVVVRDGGRVYALGATCTHYGGPLAEGLVAGGTIRCPWHHGHFDLASGRAHGCAITAAACWDVAIEGGKIRVGARREVAAPVSTVGPGTVVIIGGGAAGVACAEALRARGYHGTITMIGAEGSDPVDRPNLSKDYLAGAAPEEWVFLRTADALAAIAVTQLEGPVVAIDAAARVVRTASGRGRLGRAARRDRCRAGGCRSMAPSCRTSTCCGPSRTAGRSGRPRRRDVAPW